VSPAAKTIRYNTGNPAAGRTVFPTEKPVMSTREEKTPVAPTASPPVQTSASWRPPHAERIAVAVMSGLLAGAMAALLVFLVMRLEIGILQLQSIDLDRLNRSPLLAALIGGTTTFLVVASCIYFCSTSKIRIRVSAVFFGTLAGLFLGFLPGYCSVRDGELLANRGGLEDRSWAKFDVENRRIAFLAGCSTSVDCAAFASISLYKLYDRKRSP
jgi:hypothetical protein